MNKSLVIALLAGLMLAATSAFAQTKTTSTPPALLASGMEFFHGTAWNDVLAEAKKENRLIFVDVYTDWCGPCKLMARNTFANPEVGAFYNKNFVNYKIEAEHGEGPGLARQWQIEGYPSFLFLNYKGEIVSRGIGYMPPSDFLGAGKEALQTYAQKGAN